MKVTFIILLILFTVTMSDILTHYQQLKFQDEIKISSEPSPHLSSTYVRENKVVLSLSITNKFFLEIDKYRKEFPDLCVLDILFSQLPSYLLLKKSQRLISRICDIVSEVKGKFREINRTKGSSARDAWKKNRHSVAVHKDEIENVSRFSHELTEVKRELVVLQNKHTRALNELTQAQAEVKNLSSSKEQLEAELSKLKDENKHLHDYIKAASNKGRPYDEVEKQQQTRKLLHFKREASKALFFAETFGLVPQSLELTSNKGEHVSIDFTNQPAHPKYHQLPEEEREKIQQLSHVLDKFAVGDNIYHELHMLYDDLPTKTLLGQARDDLSQIFEIRRLPGGIDGAYISFKTEISRTLNVSNFEEIPCDTKAAFGGDGTQVSRVSSFVIISFRIIDGEKSSPQKTIAILKCPEKYENLAPALVPVLNEVNECAQLFNIFLTGDKKFQNCVLGLPVNFSTATYTCNLCKVERTKLMQTDLPWDFYHSEELARTLDDVTVGKFGVMRQPLVKIPFKNIIPCTLHLHLRGTDVLESNTVEECKQLDHQAKVHKSPANHLTRLVALINESVHFQLTEKTENGKTNLTWTSLTGTAKKKLLKELPDKFRGLLHDETVEEVIQLWKDFDKVINMAQHPDRSDAEYHLKYFDAAHGWLKNFLSLQGRRLGYNRVTPYMHTLVWHIPYLLKLHGSIDEFSGQTLEKNNDNVKAIHLRKTKKWDAAREALGVKKRVELGEEMNLDREVRPYRKKNKKWWDEDIHTERRRQRRAIDAERAAVSQVSVQPEPIDKENVETLSSEEIRSLINQMGVRTRFKNKQKLLAQYNQIVSSSRK